MPSVDDKHHDKLMCDVSLYMHDLGYTEQFDFPPGDRIERTHTFGVCSNIHAHIIRTRADRVFYNPDLNHLMKIDGKTTGWRRGSDFPIEATPLLVACDECEEYGMDYLFACRRRDGTEYGLRADRSTVARIQRIILPSWKWDENSARAEFKQFYKSRLAKWGHDCVVMSGEGTGSGDPFAAIQVDESVPGWGELIATIHSRANGMHSSRLP